MFTCISIYDVIWTLCHGPKETYKDFGRNGPGLLIVLSFNVWRLQYKHKMNYKNYQQFFTKQVHEKQGEEEHGN